MARIDFYHLQQLTLETALPRLIDKVLQAGMRAVVITTTPQRVEELAELLWADRDAWRPNGTQLDGHAEDQPVWLTADPAENPNEASVVILTDGLDSPLVETTARTLDIFNGNDDVATQAARDRWKARREAGHTLYYMQQDEGGRWTEKARVIPDT